MSKKQVQLDVNVNMTLALDKEEWEAYLEDAEGDKKWAAEAAAEEYLGYIEVEVPAGRAWVCNVDNASLLS
jgi:hypothetical protein